MGRAGEPAQGDRRKAARSAAIVLAVIVPLQIAGVLLVRRMTYTVYSVDFTRYYGPTAESILAGNGPRMPDGSVLLHYPPAYSYYTAGLMAVSRATGIPLTALIVGANIAWNALTVLAVFLLAYRMAGARLATAAGLIAGLYPPVLYLSKIAFVQVPYLAFLAWGLYAAYAGHRSRRLGCFALAGGLFGVAGLFRPAAMALLAILLLYVLIFYKGRLIVRLARPAAMLGAFALVVAPWSMYVYAQEGKVTVLGDVTQSHLEGTAQAACASDDPAGIRGLNHFAALARSPIGHSRELLRRAAKSWYHTDSGRYERASLAINVPFALLLVLGAVVALRGRGAARWGAGLGLATFVAAWGLSTLTMYLARYVTTGVILASPLMAVGLLRVTRTFGVVAHAWKAGYIPRPSLPRRKPVLPTPEGEAPSVALPLRGESRAA